MATSEDAPDGEESDGEDIAKAKALLGQLVASRNSGMDKPENGQYNLNESADKVRLETAVTRGTGTRDQEKHKLKARGEDPEAAAKNLSKALDALEEENVFERARALGNDGDE